MTTITYTEFRANMHFYLDRVFRDKAIIKVKDGSRSFVLLGESLPAQLSDNISGLVKINPITSATAFKNVSHQRRFNHYPRRTYF